MCSPRRPVKSKYGEPEHWDGLSSLFVILLRQFREMAKRVEPKRRGNAHRVPAHPGAMIEVEAIGVL